MWKSKQARDAALWTFCNLLRRCGPGRVASYKTGRGRRVHILTSVQGPSLWVPVCVLPASGVRRVESQAGSLPRSAMGPPGAKLQVPALLLLLLAAGARTRECGSPQPAQSLPGCSAGGASKMKPEGAEASGRSRGWGILGLGQKEGSHSWG